MKTLPPVSIGISFYNAERFLRQAVESVLRQTHRDWELILIDDGSTDNSLAVAQEFRDPRITLHSDGKNMRLAHRLNQITMLARHEYVARMDADDMMSPSRITRQLQFLVDNPSADLVTTGVCTITDSGNPVAKRVSNYSGVRSVGARDAVRGRSRIVHASVLARRAWMQRNPYDPDDRIAQDFTLWIRAAVRNDLSVGYIPEPLYFYREEGSVTAEKMLKGYSIGRAALRKYGRASLGVAGFLLADAALISKSALVRIADRIGETESLVRRRSAVRLDEEEESEIRAQIMVIEGQMPG